MLAMAVKKADPAARRLRSGEEYGYSATGLTPLGVVAAAWSSCRALAGERALGLLRKDSWKAVGGWRHAPTEARVQTRRKVVALIK